MDSPPARWDTAAVARGGVIYLSAPMLDVQAGALISAVGGTGGNASPTSCGKGGDGGVGRIRLSVNQASCTLAGTFNPGLTAACAAANASEKTYIAPYPN